MASTMNFNWGSDLPNLQVLKQSKKYTVWGVQKWKMFETKDHGNDQNVKLFQKGLDMPTYQESGEIPVW